MKHRVPLRMKAVACLVAGSLLFVSCAQTTRIVTEPEGAEVYVNGMYLKQSPCVFPYESGTPQTYIIDISKEGYERLSAIPITKTYKADISLLLLLCAIVPYFFSARLQPMYQFTLKPKAQPVNPLER